MSIEQQNRIIAEFMGLDLLSPEFTVLERNCEFMYDRQGTVADLEYHSSWDWLMPVVEKIEAGSLRDVIIYDKICRIEDPTLVKKFMGAGETKIQAVYEAVLEYISYIKQQQ